MGKAHSNAWSQVNHFWDLPVQAKLQVVVGRDAKGTKEMADTWGWAEASTDWKKVIKRKDIDLVDVSTPNNIHAVV